MPRRQVAKLQEQIGRRIRHLRRARQVDLHDPSPMTIAALAKKAGLSVDYVNKLELGRYMPSADKLVAIATALDVGVEELFPSERRNADKSEALEDLRTLACQYDVTQIRYLITVVRAVMRYPRRARPRN